MADSAMKYQYNEVANSDMCRLDHDCAECEHYTPDIYVACRAFECNAPNTRHLFQVALGYVKSGCGCKYSGMCAVESIYATDGCHHRKEVWE